MKHDTGAGVAVADGQATGEWIFALKKKILTVIIAILAVSIVATMIFIAFTLRQSLLKDSRQKTQELTSAIRDSLGSMMLARNPGMIQETIEHIGRNNSSVAKAFIIDRGGRVAYSSDKVEVGLVLDRFKNETCQDCHREKGQPPSESTTIITVNGKRLHRNVKVIYNEKHCYGCHPASNRINGKLIIDRSLEGTFGLVASVELILAASGLICLIVLVPLLSRVLARGLNHYIDEIVRQHVELRMLYVMTEQLSKTIDLEELKVIVMEFIREALSADEVDVIFHKAGVEFKVTTLSLSRGAVTRKKIESEDPIYGLVADWLAGKLQEEGISSCGKMVYIPVGKNGKAICLIVARKERGEFESLRRSLLKVMSGHISVAFENALLYQIAITDELTGLFTQRHFRALIDRKFMDFDRYGERFSLLMLDIDDFKNINDRLGHVVGDSVLHEVGRRITRSLRDNDFAFRYGGEEFAVILPSTDMKGARHVAERIRDEIGTSPFEKGGSELTVTVSIGVSACPANARTARDLILTADQALYRAKKTGKNKVIESEAAAV